MINYSDATEEQGKQFYRQFINKSKVVMLNLLRFKAEADYKNLADIKPGTISVAEMLINYI